MTHPARLVAIDLGFLDQPSVKRPRDHDVLAHPGIDKGVTANEVVEPSAFQLKGGRPDHFTGARVAVEGARVVFTVEDLEPVMKEAFALKDRLVFLDILVDPEEHVYPMAVSPNGAMRDMWLRKGVRT